MMEKSRRDTISREGNSKAGRFPDIGFSKVAPKL